MGQSVPNHFAKYDPKIEIKDSFWQQNQKPHFSRGTREMGHPQIE
jgi:hypothetical protein